MNNLITIPNVSREERIGSTFNHLFSVIWKTESIDHKEVIWDFGNNKFSHPFFLAPLAIYKQKCKKSIICTNKSERIASYLNTVHFEQPLTVVKEDDLKEKLRPYLSKTYIPICRFDLCQDNVDKIQPILQEVIQRQCKVGFEMTTPLSYLLGELICNMGQHSFGKFGYVFSQYLPREQCINLVLADDGITVYGSYIQTKKHLDKIQNNEAIALELANNGYSTKDLPKNESRGYGISTSKKMLVEGLHGSFFMLSGSAFHRHDRNGSPYALLPESINWAGTIILMRIPTHIPKQFNILNYIER